MPLLVSILCCAPALPGQGLAVPAAGDLAEPSRLRDAVAEANRIVRAGSFLKPSFLGFTTVAPDHTAFSLEGASTLVVTLEIGLRVEAKLRLAMSELAGNPQALRYWREAGVTVIHFQHKDGSLRLTLPMPTPAQAEAPPQGPGPAAKAPREGAPQPPSARSPRLPRLEAAVAEANQAMLKSTTLHPSFLGAEGVPPDRTTFSLEEAATLIIELDVHSTLDSRLGTAARGYGRNPQALRFWKDAGITTIRFRIKDGGRSRTLAGYP